MVRTSTGCQETGSANALSRGLALTANLKWVWKRQQEQWPSRASSHSCLRAGWKQCLGCELWLTLHQDASGTDAVARRHFLKLRMYLLSADYDFWKTWKLCLSGVPAGKAMVTGSQLSFHSSSCL